jgi:hypothetical protein
MSGIISPMRLVTYRDRAGTPGVGRLDGDRVRGLRATGMIEWLAGEREESGEEVALGDVELLAPVPEPPSVRDFFAFEGHVAGLDPRPGRAGRKAGGNAHARLRA